MRILVLTKLKFYAPRVLDVHKEHIKDPYNLSVLIQRIKPDVIISHKAGELLIPSTINSEYIYHTLVSKGNLECNDTFILARLAKAHSIPFLHITTDKDTNITKMLNHIKKEGN